MAAIKKLMEGSKYVKQKVTELVKETDTFIITSGDFNILLLIIDRLDRPKNKEV